MINNKLQSFKNVFLKNFREFIQIIYYNNKTYNNNKYCNNNNINNDNK